MVIVWGEVLWDQFPDGAELGGAPANVAWHLGQRAITGGRRGPAPEHAMTTPLLFATSSYQYLATSLVAASGWQAGTIDRTTFPDGEHYYRCLLYTSPSPRDRTRSRMPSSA